MDEQTKSGQWFVQRPNEPVEGPMSGEQLQQQIVTGEVPPAARVCEAGGSEWQSASEVKLIARPPPPPPPRTRARKSWRWVLSGAAALLLMLLAAAFLFTQGSASARDADVKRAIVRVRTDSGGGTGFFVKGPDHHAYVVTAFHVVESGGSVLIERLTDVSDKEHYVEAYPDTELVAFDADADLAVIRLKNIDAAKFETLPLADKPVKDEAIVSYGFPDSNLTSNAGLISKDGKVENLVKFSVYDRLAGTVLRKNAVDGVLVSTAIEPGFSGGPSCNDSGEVIGVNMLKDLAYVDQNGVVSVEAVRALMANVAPLEERAEPTIEEVAALIKRVEQDYLRLHVDERTKLRSHAFHDMAEQPRYLELAQEVRKMERDLTQTYTGLSKDSKLTGAAALGIALAQLPGHTLETYHAEATQQALQRCESKSRVLGSFLGQLEGDEAASKTNTRRLVKKCDERAVRPLMWDLTAASLQWDGSDRSVEVTKVERVDDEREVYRANIKLSNVRNVVTVWVARDAGRLALKLFNNDGQLYCLHTGRSIAKSALAGTWYRSKPPQPVPNVEDAEMTMHERLDVTIDGNGAAAIKHTVNINYSLRNRNFTCNRKRQVKSGMVQGFSGKFKNGAVIAAPDRTPQKLDDHAKGCFLTYSQDHAVVLKTLGDKLLMYRTSGTEFPEVAEFTRASND